MRATFSENQQEQFIDKMSRIWKDAADRTLIAKTILAMDTRYNLFKKMARESGVEDILEQLLERLANSYPSLSNLHNKAILDIACGSNTSKAPPSYYFGAPFSKRSSERTSTGFTAMFEPWFCRILLELEATPVGVDFGNLDAELFTHYRIDLGKPGALDFLPDHSFDAVQDSRLFGSPEFTAKFPHQADRLIVAQELMRQEQRLLKPDGIIIHSDAMSLWKR